MADNEVYRIEIPIQTQDQTEPALSRAQQKLSKFEQSMKKTEEHIQKMNRTKMQLVISAVDKASSVIGFIGSKARALVSKTWRMTFGIVDLATKPLRGILNFATSIQGMITGIAAGLAVQKIVAGPIALADSLSEAEVGFETMLKSADAAKKMMADIKEFAIKTPFETFDIVQQTQRMLAMGWSAKNVLRDMERIGNAAAATGKGSEGIERIVLALGQIRMKGKLSAEELNQLAEAGVRAREYIAKGLGVSVPKAIEMAEKGMIDANKAIDLILKGMDEFNGQMDKTANRTVKGLWSQIKDTFTVGILEKWGRGLQTGAIAGLVKLNDWLSKNRDTIGSWGETLGKIGGMISITIVDKLDKLVKKVGEVFNSDEFKNAATLGEKLKIAWDKIIVEPFDEWWNKSGQKTVTDKAADIGRALGGGIGRFIMSALGVASDMDKLDKVQDSPFLKAGTAAGEAFLDAFLDAFDAQKVADKAVDAFKNITKEAGKVAPGGEKPSAASWLSAGLLAYLGIKGGKGIYKVAKGGTDIWKTISGLFKGGKGAAQAAEATAEAASTAAAAAEVMKAAPETVKIFGANGEVLKTVVKNADDAAKAAETMTKAAGKGGKLAELFGKIKGSKGVPVLGTAIGIIGSTATVATAAPAQRGKEATGEIGGWAGALAGGAAGAKAGAALGGAIGSIIPGAGTAAGAAVGGTIGGIAGGIAGSFGGEKALEWIYDQKDAIMSWSKKTGQNIGTFFSKTLPETASKAGKGLSDFTSKIGESVGGFFTETLPGAASEAGKGVTEFATNMGKTVSGFFTDTIPNFVTEQMPYALGYTAGAITKFFMDTLPQGLSNLWTAVGDFFTQSIPTWWGNVCTSVDNWWNGTIVTGWNNLWAAVGSFFTETIPTWASGVYNSAVNFFTVSVPEFFSSLWSSVYSFFTETVPTWSTGIYNTAATFFTVTVPAFFSDLWSSVYGFFTDTLPTWAGGVFTKVDEFITQDIPEFLSSLWGNVKTLVTEKIPDKAKEIKDKVVGWLGDLKDWAGDIWSRVKSSFTSGYEAGRSGNTTVAKHAYGGILTRPHMGLIAEAGAEAVIPLSYARRQRGLEIWKQAGRMLGVLPYAEGGIAGETEAPAAAPTYVPTANKPSVVINVQAQPVFEIKTASTANDVLAAIRQHQEQIADELSDEIAEKLAAIFNNMPEAEGA